MVKINITIEGENISEIIDELFNMGLEILESNKKEVREAMKLLANEAIDTLMERKILEKGATLYKKINSEINWTYKKDRK